MTIIDYYKTGLVIPVMFPTFSFLHSLFISRFYPSLFNTSIGLRLLFTTGLTIAHIFCFHNSYTELFANTFLLNSRNKNYNTSKNRYFTFDTQPKNTKCAQCSCKVKGGVWKLEKLYSNIRVKLIYMILHYWVQRIKWPNFKELLQNT